MLEWRRNALLDCSCFQSLRRHLYNKDQQRLVEHIRRCTAPRPTVASRAIKLVSHWSTKNANIQPKTDSSYTPITPTTSNTSVVLLVSPACWRQVVRSTKVHKTDGQCCPPGITVGVAQVACALRLLCFRVR
jgi:hypothetical protein